MDALRNPDYLQVIRNTPVGSITLLSDGEALVGLWLEGQKYFLENASARLCEGKGIPALERAKDWLGSYFAGEKPNPLDVPLAPRGSGFRQLVWGLLCEIPYGYCVSYGEIAKNLARKRGLPRMSARAVGGAIGHNPVSIIIPCHRVVGSDGGLTGYAGGLGLKAFLLGLEGVELGQLKVSRAKRSLRA